MSEAVKTAENALRAAQIADLRRAVHGQTTMTEPAQAPEPKPPQRLCSFIFGRMEKAPRRMRLFVPPFSAALNKKQPAFF